MKNINRNILTAILVFALSFELLAQAKSFNTESLERAEKMSIVTMDSDINSLVESVIFNMLIFKDVYPEYKYDRILNKLNDLSVNGKSVAIRYKAQLASMFISNPEMFSDIKITNKENPNRYFIEIASRVEKNLVASN